MSRKLPEGIRARQHRDNTGKLVIRYQARAKPEGKQLTKTFDNLADAVRWRSYEVNQVKLGEYGAKEARRKQEGKTTINNLLIPYYVGTWLFINKSSCKNEDQMIKAFQARAPKLCDTPFSERKELTNGFRKYVEDRMKDGVKDSTIRRELNPIRHMFQVARKNLGVYADPFRDLDLPEEPASRQRVLKPEEDLLLYKAIEERCRTEKLRLRWLCLVFLALSTALRKGVLLNLKWEDVDWHERIITIKNTYWAGKKKAPPMVPLTFITENTLKMYYQQLSDSETDPSCHLFPSKETSYRLFLSKRTVRKKTTSGYDSTWSHIVRRSGLPNLIFHDLRRTATTRYALKPVGLSIRENDYLLGHIRGLTQKAYEAIEFMNPIREKLDAADDLARTVDDIFDDGPVQPMMPDAIAYTRAMLRIYEQDPFGNPVTLPLRSMISPKEWLEQKAAWLEWKEGRKRELPREEPKKKPAWKPGELSIKFKG